MSHHRGIPGPPLRQNRHPVPVPTCSKPKRLRTKRERDAAKFGTKVPLGGSRRGPAVPPRWLQAPRWGGLPLGSPLGPLKPVVITQKRLCHRGLFNREVKSLDVRRLLTPGPGEDGPPPAPQIEEEELGEVPAEALKELVASLASLLGGSGAFLGRDLVSERRRSLVAALGRHRRGPLDLGVFLAHRTPAQPPGQGTPPREVRPGPPGPLGLGGWEVGDPPARTPSPLRAVDTPPPPPRAPSPIFGAPGEQETPFSWSSADEDETPRGLPQAWGGPGGLLPGPPPFWRSPQPPPEEEEQEGAGDGCWTPIAAPTFSPDPPPWDPPQSREPRGLPRALRPPRTPKIWRVETPWGPPDPSRPRRDASRAPWDSPGPPRASTRPLWELPDPARAHPSYSRPPRAPQIWSPEPRRAPLEPPRPLWDPPNPPRPLWDPRPWSPDPPRAAPAHPRPPRTPQLWNPEPFGAPLDAPRPLWDPPRPCWEPPDAPRPLWDSPDPPWAPPDPPRSPRILQLWSPELPRDPPGPPQTPEPSRCCCRRLCRDTAQRDPLRHHRLCRHVVRRDTFHHGPPRPAPLCRDMPRRDPPPCCQRPPKRCRPDWGGPRDSPPPSPLLPGGWGCPCRGDCWGGGL